MYDQNILLTRTGQKLLCLFDKMELLVSQLYHNTLTNDKTEALYFEMIEDIEKLREIRSKVITKHRRRNMF